MFDVPFTGHTSSYGYSKYCGPLSVTISSGGPNMLTIVHTCRRIHCWLLSSSSLQDITWVIIGNEQMIDSFVLEQIAGHLGPRGVDT